MQKVALSALPENYLLGSYSVCSNRKKKKKRIVEMWFVKFCTGLASASKNAVYWNFIFYYFVGKFTMLFYCSFFFSFFSQNSISRLKKKK